MKRILKSIVEWWNGRPDYIPVCWLDVAIELEKIINERNNHEKPTANPYTTYLCIDNNSK